MTDLSSLSDDQLKSLYTAPAPVAAPRGQADLGKMSDDDLKALHAALPAHESIISDVAKSGGIGVAKGAVGLAGSFGDVGHLLGTARDKYIANPINRALGLQEVDLDKPDPALKIGSQAIQSAIESKTGKFYEPQTVAGQYAQTAGEFAPALLGGGEGLLSKLATRVAAPAVASETAGQVTKGTALEPYARIGGAIAGGSLASALSRAPELAAPTIEELKDAARAQYNHPDVKSVRIDPDATDFLHHWIRNDLENGNNAGFRATNEPKTFAAIEELSNPNQSLGRQVGAPATIDDVQSVRKVLGRIADTRDVTGNLTSDAVAANRAIGHVNNFLENLRQPDLIAGNANRAGEILRDAGANWGAAKRAEEVATRAENARIQAASTHGGGNINNALRQALRPLVKNDFQKARGFNPAEQDALESAVTGSWLGNGLRQVGKYGPDTGLKGLHHISAAIASGGATIPASLGALVAKLAGDASTRRAIGRLDTTLRERSPLHAENIARTGSPMLPSQATPGVMLNNPNYVAPRPAGQPVASGLLSALLAGQASRPQSRSPVQP
jgi:hypothetical protein